MRAGRPGLGPKAHGHFIILQNNSNKFELIQIKDEHTLLEIFQIKYEFEGLEKRNSFLHRNFSRFELDFE
jgi:hypothetical protein